MNDTPERPIITLATRSQESVRQVAEGTEGAISVGVAHLVLTDDAPTKEELIQLIKDAEKGEFSNMSIEDLEQGPSYITLGGWLGSQSAALCLMGLGAHLGVFDIVGPWTLGIEDKDMAAQMMGSGFIMAMPKAGVFA